MTFKGLKYEQLIDIKLLQLEAVAYLNMLQESLKNYSKQRDINLIEKYKILVDLQEKYVAYLNRASKALYNDFNKIGNSLSDIEQAVFYYKFIVGLTNQEIQDKLAICRTAFFNNCDSIEEKLKDSEAYKRIKELFRITKKKTE